MILLALPLTAQGFLLDDSVGPAPRRAEFFSAANSTWTSGSLRSLLVRLKPLFLAAFKQIRSQFAPLFKA